MITIAKHIVTLIISINDLKDLDDCDILCLRSLSNEWPSQTTTSGSTTARRSCTWSSECLYFHLVANVAEQNDLQNFTFRCCLLPYCNSRWLLAFTKVCLQFTLVLVYFSTKWKPNCELYHASLWYSFIT